MKARASWRVFIRSMIAVLFIVLVVALFLALHPPALRSALLALPLPGVVRIPDPGPTPLPPSINASRGNVPVGAMAFSGEYASGNFACAFLLALDNERRVGVSAAHATPVLNKSTHAQLYAPGGVLAAELAGQVDRGRAFTQDRFDLDYVIWSVLGDPSAELFLKPDPRGGGEPGELVLVFGQSGGGSTRWPGVVISATASAIWVQLDDSFHPAGYSGCPVVSQFTGRLIGMAVAGEDKPPVMMGLHPVGSLVEKASAALAAR